MGDYKNTDKLFHKSNDNKKKKEGLNKFFELCPKTVSLFS